jgi:CBS domain-containing protein
VPEDHLLGRAADLRHPARIFARGERVRDERVTDVVLPAGVDAATPECRQPDALVEPLLGERLRAGRFRRLPVVGSDGRLLGIVALDDVLLVVAEELGEIGPLLRREAPHRRLGRQT